MSFDVREIVIGFFIYGGAVVAVGGIIFSLRYGDSTKAIKVQVIALTICGLSLSIGTFVGGMSFPATAVAFVVVVLVALIHGGVSYFIMVRRRKLDSYLAKKLGDKLDRYQDRPR